MSRVLRRSRQILFNQNLFDLVLSARIVRRLTEHVALQEKYSDLMREATEIKTTKSKRNKIQRVEKSGPRNDQVEATPLTSGGTADIQNNNKLVCTGINGMCQMSQGTITFDLVIYNEFHEKFELIKDITAVVLDTPYQMILGRPDIKKYNILPKLSANFGESETKTGTPQPHKSDLATPAVPLVSGLLRRVDPPKHFIQEE